MTGRTLGDFEVREEIGKGGMGRVYKGRQISLERDVAIKILATDLSGQDEFRERFDNEAKAVASLVQENIVQIYSKGLTEEGIPYFAMEYVEGEDLRQKLKSGETFSEREVLGIAIQVCRGLEAAEKKKIVHRDIKPGNIIITTSGIAKITDFGLAKILIGAEQVTRTNVYMGTAAYTSPEQGEGGLLDHRTDIYSLGIVCYQLLTGVVPFTAESPSSVIYKHVHEAPRPLRSINPGLSPEAEAAVLKALEKKPEDRFQSAAEFRKALEKIVSHPDGMPGAPPSRTRQLVIAGVAILLIAGAVVMFSLLRKGPSGNTNPEPKPHVPEAQIVQPAPEKPQNEVKTVSPLPRAAKPGKKSAGMTQMNQGKAEGEPQPRNEEKKISEGERVDDAGRIEMLRPKD